MIEQKYAGHLNLENNPFEGQCAIISSEPYPILGSDLNLICENGEGFICESGFSWTGELYHLFEIINGVPNLRKVWIKHNCLKFNGVKYE